MQAITIAYLYYTQFSFIYKVPNYIKSQTRSLLKTTLQVLSNSFSYLKHDTIAWKWCLILSEKFIKLWKNRINWFKKYIPEAKEISSFVHFRLWKDQCLSTNDLIHSVISFFGYQRPLVSETVSRHISPGSDHPPFWSCQLPVGRSGWEPNWMLKGDEKRLWVLDWR